MSGILYLVGTPIGNLGDLSPRAQDTLAQCDFIAAEDTRVTLKLLNRFGIKKPRSNKMFAASSQTAFGLFVQCAFASL